MASSSHAIPSRRFLALPGQPSLVAYTPVDLQTRVVLYTGPILGWFGGVSCDSYARSASPEAFRVLVGGYI